jgi:hypothetical protein
MPDGARLRYVLLTLAMGVGLACGPIGAAQPDGQDEAASGEAGGAASSASRADSVLPLAPDPVTVQVTLDQAVFGQSNFYGGSVRFEGDDGVRVDFRLYGGGELFLTQGADGALEPIPSPRVTVTRIAGLAGLPVEAEFIAGVALEPGGSRVYPQASLTFELPTGVAHEDLVGFAYEGDGEQFHLVPVLVLEPYAADVGPMVFMDIGHFSGYGVMRTSQANAQRLGAPRPLGLQAEHALGRLRERDRAGARGRAILQDWYTQSVAARIAAAGGCSRSSGSTADFIAESDGLLDAAIEFMEWREMVGKAGQDEAFAQQIDAAAMALWSKIGPCLSSICELCLELQDPDAASRMFALSTVYRHVTQNMELAPLESADWHMLTYACFYSNGMGDRWAEFARPVADGGPGVSIPTTCP